MWDQIKAVLEIVVKYFIEIFKYWGYITDEDIENAKDVIDDFKPAE